MRPRLFVTSGSSRLGVLLPCWIACLLLCLPQIHAQDPPHRNLHPTDDCSACHTLHGAPGMTLTSFAGNVNLCLSCHVAGGTASAKALAAADQAVPSPGLPAGTNASGTSHRWDSGAAGRIVFLGGAATNSTGAIVSSGTYTGAYARTFTIAITNAGAVGTARFNWTATTPGGGAGTNLLTGTNVALGEGLFLTFVDGTNVSFQVNDKWHLYVRTDLRAPTNTQLLVRMTNGLIMCSTCHDEHSQRWQPFDPLASALTNGSGAFTGTNRHFMRIANDSEQLCYECHWPRFVTNSVFGSHPVGVVINTNANYKVSTNLPLERITSRVRCETCHSMHFAVSTDGTLLRINNRTSLCIECHTLANTTSPASHLVTTNSNTLWPGGQYGTTFPQVTSLGARGSCLNCHQPHGWPDAVNLSTNYPRLLVDSPYNLCITCHDGSPASDQLVDFSGTIWTAAAVTGVSAKTNLNTHHDVKLADQARSGAIMTCTDCHDPHQATPAVKVRADPDPGDGRVPAAGQSWTGSDYMSEWCLDCHDGSFPSTITPPTTALLDIHTTHATGVDAHGTGGGNPSLRAGYGWAAGDVVPCTACHDAGHGSTTNLFQLKTTIYSKDGTTPIPSDGGGTVVRVTNNDSTDPSINGYNWCNTCHTGSMGSKKDNCFDCHFHGTRF